MSNIWRMLKFRLFGGSSWMQIHHRTPLKVRFGAGQPICLKHSDRNRTTLVQIDCFLNCTFVAIFSSYRLRLIECIFYPFVYSICISNIIANDRTLYDGPTFVLLAVMRDIKHEKGKLGNHMLCCIIAFPSITINNTYYTEHMLMWLHTDILSFYCEVND